MFAFETFETCTFNDQSFIKTTSIDDRSFILFLCLNISKRLVFDRRRHETEIRQQFISSYMRNGQNQRSEYNNKI